jgi:drug/metabolite transporter (DMT)-like permease
MFTGVVTMDDRVDSRLPYLALAIGMIAISTSAILIRFSNSDPLVIGSYRQSFATLLFVPFLFKDRANELLTIPRSKIIEMAIAGILLGGHFGFFISSVKATSIAASVLLGTCHVVYVAIIGWLILGERLNQRAIYGTIIALFGIIVLFWGDLVEDPGNFRGNILAFISGILAGLYYLGGRRLRKEISLPMYALVVYFFSALTMWSVVIVQDLQYQSLPVVEIQLFILMALIPTLLGHTTQNWALAYLPAYVVSISLLAEPVGSGILAWFVFDELPSLGVFIGGLTVLVGVYVAATSEKASNL